MNQYTRYLAVVFCAVQAYGIAVGLEGSQGVVLNPGWFFRLSTVITLVGGTMFLMWLGEQITSRGVGNGMSLLIFTSIAATFPAAMGAIWQARCERDAGGLHPGVSLASRAASLALSSLREAIRRDWSRIVGAAPAPLPSMCAAWFRGFDSSITLAAFKEQWASPEFFCSVEEAAGLPPSLEVRLGGPHFPALPA
jgi:hypothetical protein